MRTQPAGSHFVSGKYLNDPDGEALTSIYPATGECIAQLNLATDAILQQAIRAAEAGFAVWSATPAAQRAQVLRRAAEMIRQQNRELSVLETLDTGKALQETLVADAASGADCLDYFASIAATGLDGQHIDLGGSFAYTRREPLGVCLGIGAWNYPIQIACWKAAPALACGNAMIFKPAPQTPLSALKLAQILSEAGLPDGVFNVLQTDVAMATRLVEHPSIEKISLTGSTTTGRVVASNAAARLKHVSLELGGKSPLIIFEDAHLDNAVGAAMLANFYSTGQVCTNGTRVFVHRDIREEFLARLKTRTEAIRLGDPLDEATQMGPLVSQAQYERVMGYLEIGRGEGATLVTGGAAAHVPELPDGLFVQPTVFCNVHDDMSIAREEIFGPVMSVLDFDTEQDVIARANATEFGLAAGVFTRDIQRAHRVIGQLQAGTCWINAYNLTPIEMPFGGYKQSGIGRENAHAAINHYSQIKSVYVEMGDVDSPY